MIFLMSSVNSSVQLADAHRQFKELADAASRRALDILKNHAVEIWRVAQCYATAKAAASEFCVSGTPRVPVSSFVIVFEHRVSHLKRKILLKMTKELNLRHRSRAENLRKMLATNEERMAGPRGELLRRERPAPLQNRNRSLVGCVR